MTAMPVATAEKTAAEGETAAAATAAGTIAERAAAEDATAEDPTAPAAGAVPAARPTTAQRAVDHLVAAVYAAACFGAVLAPALAVRWAVFRSDIGNVGGRDIVAASVLVGAGHAAVAWARLRCERRTAARRSHIWIASLNALVVLALSASLLVLAVLGLFADEHAAFANRGLPVVALWTALQLMAVALAEVTGRLVFWWLEPHPAPHRACRWGVLPPARRFVLRLTPRWLPAWRSPVPAIEPAASHPTADGAAGGGAARTGT